MLPYHQIDLLGGVAHNLLRVTTFAGNDLLLRVTVPDPEIDLTTTATSIVFAGFGIRRPMTALDEDTCEVVVPQTVTNAHVGANRFEVSFEDTAGYITTIAAGTFIIRASLQTIPLTTTTTVDEIPNYWIKGDPGDPGEPGEPGPQGPPGPAVGYVHTQANPSAVWTIQHNLGNEPVFICTDESGELMLGWSAQWPSSSVAVLTWPVPVSGSCHVS